MLGAIIGDMVGSPYEFDHNNIKTTDFPFWSNRSHFTDDTVMTLAVAEALMDAVDKNVPLAETLVASMQKLGRQYPGAGYGGRFRRWLSSADPKPYNSWGNGSAMRVSPVGWFYDTLVEVEDAARTSAAVTHNHPEGIKGAQATAGAIFLARTGSSKDDITRYVAETYGYDLTRTLDEIRPTYHMDESCQGSVPESIIAFLESESFEDAIRKAVSIGGDSDTVAAICGGIADGFYGVPEDVAAEARPRLDETLLAILERWENR